MCDGGVHPRRRAVGCDEAEARRGTGRSTFIAPISPMKHVLAGNEQRMLMKLIVRRAITQWSACTSPGRTPPK